MKKLGLTLAAVALALAGCGGDAEAPPTNAPVAPTTATTSAAQTPVECATDCVDEYSTAIDALEACSTFDDAQECDDAIRDLEALHDPILAAHGAQVAAQVGLVEAAIAEWDEDDCATKNSCALEWTKVILDAQQLELDLTA